MFLTHTPSPLLPEGATLWGCPPDAVRCHLRFLDGSIVSTLSLSQRRGCSLASYCSPGASDVLFGIAAPQISTLVPSPFMSPACLRCLVLRTSYGQRCQPPVDGKPTWWQSTFAACPTRARLHLLLRISVVENRGRRANAFPTKPSVGDGRLGSCGVGHVALQG